MTERWGFGKSTAEAGVNSHSACPDFIPDGRRIVGIMHRRTNAVLFITAIALACDPASAVAQGTMRRPTPESDTIDSNGNLKAGALPGRARISGTVVFADGPSATRALVDIYAECGGPRLLVATADSKGRFSVSRDSFASMTGATACALRAVLPGYRSAAQTLPDAKTGADEKVGKLTLQPLSPNTDALKSTADESASKAQQKLFDKALDEAARTEWGHAIDSLRKVTTAYPGYSSAWLTLGLLQLGGGDQRGALASFLAAVHADPKFAPPLIAAARLEAAQGDWKTARAHAQQAIDLNPTAFPDAWALDALGNLNLEDLQAAAKCAREGLRLNAADDYPDLEYALGSILASQQQVPEAIEHLQAYLKRAPDGSNADTARSMLAQMRTSAAQTPAASTVPAAPEPQTSGRSAPSADGPPLDQLRDRNAPLLSKIPDYTCLETITRTHVDANGRARDAGLFRVEIGITGDREMYGYAGGKRFSGESLAALLGNSFSTTGVFGMLAQALIAGNGVTVTFGGREAVDGEAVYRYNFRSAAGAAPWSIQYGKASGHAGEDGWFLVESSHLTLRRVVVRAFQIPAEMRLKRLEAEVDYQPETVGGRQVLLPYEARVHVEEAAGTQRVSRMFFDHCRSFGAESTVSFEANNSPDSPASAAKGQELPPDLNIKVALVSPVSLQSAAENDLLTASVVTPVSLRGRQIIASGALVEGHVRPCRGEPAVMIELDRVQTLYGWEPFYAHLASVASAQASMDSSSASRKTSGPQVPGVAKIVFATPSAELAAGTLMLWKTEPLEVAPAATQPQLSTGLGMP